MVLTVMFGVITTERDFKNEQRFNYYLLIIFINVVFYIYWIVIYIKVFMIGIKKAISLLPRKEILSKLTKFVSAITVKFQRNSKKEKTGLNFTTVLSSRRINKLNNFIN